MKKAGENLILTAGCKINLYLEICGQRPDGYHELLTLFCPLPEPSDRLTIISTEKGFGLQLTCNRRELEDKSNILYSAYQTYAEATGFSPALNIHLEKNIPSGAGLGGGSSDAATLLKYLNSICPANSLSQAAMIDLAVQVGSDVPFFLLNTPAIGRGRGEALTPIAIDLSGLILFLICPEISISTAEAYRAWDGLASPRAPFLTILGLTDRKPSCFTPVVLYNSFEQAVFPLHHSLRDLKLALLSRGATGCVMSGSGSSLVALFRSEALAKEARCWLAEMPVSVFEHYWL